MSMPLASRSKDRVGAGAGAMVTDASAKPFKSITPVSDRSLTVVELAKRSCGKENPRSSSRIRATAVPVAGISKKPTIRPMARIDKSSACGIDKAVADSRVRWSTSSFPRGRSSSPSEFSRVLTDLRNDRNSRASVDKSAKGSKGEIDLSVSRVETRSRVSGMLQQKKAAFSDIKARSSDGCENGGRFNVGIEKPKGAGITSSRALDNRSKEANLRSVSRKSHHERSISVSKLDRNVSSLVVESKGRSRSTMRSKDIVEKGEKVVDTSFRETIAKSFNRFSDSENLKEKSVSEESGARPINKYPSKIHEKLAFLEGKVKRIATDIKRTKEMLDMNNPDASKLILSDIQEKIYGIEKAIGHVENGSSVKEDSAQSFKNDIQKIKQTSSQKSVGNGLNKDELEARFFPHHKLLRDRTSLKTLLGSTQADDAKIAEEQNCETKAEDKLSTSVDENHITSEFLASLSISDQSKITKRGTSSICLETNEVEEMDCGDDLDGQVRSNEVEGDTAIDTLLADESLDESDDQETIQVYIEDEDAEDSYKYQLNEIGCKTSTGGWFVSEGESALLAHDDGSCSFYDIANCEQKSEYKPPALTSSNIWRDCWILRAPGADGCAARYVVAASAGNTTAFGFCSWDFYTKTVKSFHLEDRTTTTTTRTALASLPNNNSVHRRTNPLCAQENRQQWWYRPCGPLIASTASCQKDVRVYDIRDGESVMEWQLGSNVFGMEYSSPLQWRNRGKLVIAEGESLSLWDVSSQTPQPLMNVSSGHKISALHINNTDAELGGGVRQRVSSSEAEGNDGVFCTPDSINVLDFRNPSGIALKISKHGANVQSVFSRGDNIFLGCTTSKNPGKTISPQIQHYSLRKQRLVNSFVLPDSGMPLSSSLITQVWGNSNTVMGLSRSGLYVFDAFDDEFSDDYGKTQNVKEIIGPNDLCSPSFDCLGSRVLIISRDRPALWRYVS